MLFLEQGMCGMACGNYGHGWRGRFFCRLPGVIPILPLIFVRLSAAKKPANDASVRTSRGKKVAKRKRPPQWASEKPFPRQREDVSQNNAARLRATIEASVDCVITIDAQSTILEFNAAAERTFGYAREDVIGKPLTEKIIPPSLREAHLKGMAALMKGGPAKLLGRRVEMPAMRADSTEFPIELTITRIDSEDPPLFTAYLRDITDRKRAEEALRKSEKLFTAFMDNLPGFAWIKDIEGRYVYVNETFLQLRNAVGKTDAELWPAEIAATYRANDNQVIQTKHALQTKEPFAKDPEKGFHIVSKFPIFDQDGAVVMVGGASVDISQLTQAEKALDAQALRYKTLMATSTDSIYVLDEKGDLQEANAAFLRRRGYTAAEMKGLNVADWDAGWDREKLEEERRKLVGMSSVFETRHRCKDGSVFDVEVCATGVRIGSEQFIFCVTRDITERKRAEERLRRSEEKFKALFDLAPVGIAVLDRQRNVVDANPALAQIMRVPWEELLRPGNLRRTILKADGTPMLPDEFPSARVLRENRSIGNIETGIILENGEAVWLQVSAAPLALPDASAVVITQDITERRGAEEELKREKEILAKIFDNIPVMIGFVGADGGVKLANREWERTLGWTLKELRDQNVDIFAEAYPDLSYRQKVLDFIAAASGESTDLKIKVRDGQVIDAACSVVRLSDGTKVAIAQDITERKRAAKALEGANERLQSLSRRLFQVQEDERRHLARELHDEIGQTLTAAKINLQIVAQDVPEKMAGRLDDSIQLLDRLLRQVRQLSLDLRPPLLDELGLVPTLRWLVDQQAQRAGLRVTFHADVDGLVIDPTVQTTCFRVAQEAITNIIRHSGAEKVAVVLRRKSGRLWLSVRDDGAGFDPAAIPQGTARHSTLGLVSMRERILLIRGGLEVRSAPGKGTEIRAWFPVARAEQPSRTETS
jgi:PAS domain S-box-containing protein